MAQQVPSIPNKIIIVSVAIGVGIFLVVAQIRMLFGIPLSYMLVGLYIFVFVLSFFVPSSFWAVAFDSGGVTTGPMTVPFIMALGVGISSVRNDRHASNDSFGLVALCSVGPILAVLLLGMIYKPNESAYVAPSIPEIANSKELWNLFMVGLPTYFKEIAISLFPIILFFGIFQVFVLKLDMRNLKKIIVGMIYTYISCFIFNRSKHRFYARRKLYRPGNGLGRV